MSDVNWNALYAYPNAGDAFAKSFQQSQETGRLNAARSAMAILAQDPHNPRALQILAKADPQTAMQYQQQLIESAKAGLAEHQDSIIKGGEIVRQFQPHDQASWDQTLQAAAMAGVDISQVPRIWNDQTAQYAQGIVHIADAFKPQPSNVQLVPVQPGGSVLQYNKQTGQTQPLVVPNDGSHPVGATQAPAPVTAVNPQTGQRIQLNPQTNQWEPVQGGAGGNASGGFPQ